jgi:hypothetical protein
MANVLRLPISNVPAGGDYTAAIALGSEGSPAQVLLDTGSSTLGIIPRRYDPASDTKLTGTTLAQDVIYGTGAWAGPVVQTSVSMGTGTNSVSIDAYVAVIESDYEGFGEADGIMGLAYAPLNPAFDMESYLSSHHHEADTYPWPFHIRSSKLAIERFLQRLQTMPEKSLPPYFAGLESTDVVPNLFAFYTLRSIPSAATADPANDPLNNGWFILGGGLQENDLYTGEFEEVDVVDDRYYNVELLAVKVGSGAPTAAAPVPAAEAANAGSNAVVDSGTQSLVLAPDVYEAVMRQLAAGGTHFEQAIRAGAVEQAQLELDDWPTVSFVLRGPEGKKQEIQLDCAPSTYWQLDAGKAGVARFMIENGGFPQSILGLPLFNNYYVVFDRSQDAGGVLHFATIKQP